MTKGNQASIAAAKKLYYQKTRLPSFYRKWSKEEDKLIFDRSLTDTEVSGKIGRSVMAIQIRRSRLVKNKKSPANWTSKATQSGNRKE